MVFVVDADACRVGRRSVIGAEIGSRIVDELRNESRELSETSD